MLQKTCQLEELVEQIEAENAQKAESVAQLLPQQKQQRRARRSSVSASSLLGRMASASPKADIRGVGQQVSIVLVLGLSDAHTRARTWWGAGGGRRCLLQTFHPFETYW